MKKAERDRRITAAKKRYNEQQERFEKFEAKAREARHARDLAKRDAEWLESAPTEEPEDE